MRYFRAGKLDMTCLKCSRKGIRHNLTQKMFMVTILPKKKKSSLFNNTLPAGVLQIARKRNAEVNSFKIFAKWSG